jgi:hypothetical protein
VEQVLGLKNRIFCDITPCSPLKVNRRFKGTCRLHLQGRRISQARNKRQAGSRQQTSFDFQRTTVVPWGVGGRI